ncbi:cell division ATP-binding protein FtsE [candidate division WOR-3 bacterium]|jgi:cell division transport system ATP-binding protein|nr:cell division ATP-binding protein FtsE [candidate division WOR-3 bacterium]
MVEIRNVKKSFRKDWYALNDISLSVDKGDFVFLTGPTGSGKSTLLRLIYMDIFPDEGEVAVAGFLSSTIKKHEIPLLRRRIGIIFQDFKLLRNKTVYENVAFALEVTGESGRKMKEKVMKALALVGLSHKRNEFPYRISGGEQQKAAIARALVREPFILLADEPTGNIDPEGSMEIVRILQDINTSGTAILMATHDVELAKRVSNNSVHLEEGRMVEG